MAPEEKVAYINAQTACALAEIEGMKAENANRLQYDNAIAYRGADFNSVCESYGITHNQVISFFGGY